MLKKVITLSIIILFTLIVVLYCTASLLLSDDDINGFSGTFGIIRLTFSSSDNVKLNDNPTQYLIICYKNFEIDNENTFSFIREYADSFEGTYENQGTFIKDGKIYNFNRRAFTSHYWIITITEDNGFTK